MQRPDYRPVEQHWYAQVQINARGFGLPPEEFSRCVEAELDSIRREAWDRWREENRAAA